MKFIVKTLGCKLNQSESDEIITSMTGIGYSQTLNFDDADIVIINTCTVTSTADSKARQLIAKSLRKENAKIIVTGCAAENPDSGLQKFENIIFVEQGKKVDVVKLFKDLRSSADNKSIKRSRPLVKIQDGCDHECSYCIVAKVRGKSKSLEKEEIFSKIDELVKDDFKEIVLTGVDIGDYKNNDGSLVPLLKEIFKLGSDFRIRLSSLEPQSLDYEFIQYFKNENRLCSHIHIPLQSGSDKILKLMKRPYSYNDFFTLTNKLKKARKDILITTDIIVGFPSEDEEDFKATIKACQDLKFSKAHVFRYSKRAGVLASTLNNQVDEKIKKDRSKKLSTLCNKISNEIQMSLINSVQNVLIERTDGKYLIGKTSNYVNVFLEGRSSPGALEKAKLIKYENNRLFGKIISE